MKKVLLIISLVFLVACGGVKKTQEALNTGNYQTAMNRAIENLSKNKTKTPHEHHGMEWNTGVTRPEGPPGAHR